MSDLLVGLAFTIGTFFILLLLYFVYIFQDKRTGIKAKLYKYAIIINAVLIISELISSYLLYDELMPKFGEYLLKFHWYTGVAYFYFFYFYADSHLRNIEEISVTDYLWKRKEGKIVTILTLIFTVVYCFIPFKDLDYHALSYLPGMPAYSVFGYAVAIVMVTFFKYLRKKNKTKNEIYFIILFVSVPTIDLGLQLIWLTVAFSPTLMAFLLLGCYFLLENPDLYVANELEKAKKELELINTHKKEVMAQKSKDCINDVLSVAQSNYEAINNSDLDSYMNNLNMNIYSLIEIIYDIENNLNMLIINDNKNVIEDYEYNTSTLLNKLYNYAEYKANAKNLKIVFDIDQFLPISLSGDVNIVYQILLNSLCTAINNTEIGKITLKIRCNFNNNLASLHIDIFDTSNGLTQEEVKMINESNPIDDKKYEKYNISKQYVSYLRGDYKVSSVYGAGATISMAFSQKIVNSAKSGEFTPKTINYNFNLSNRKILIVDNNALELVNLFKKYNISCETVSTFDECINKLKTDETYTTVFLNPIINPNDNEIAKSIKSLMTTHSVPNKVIVLAQNYLSGSRKNYMSLGYDNILIRPYNKYDFDELIRKI